MWSDIESKQDFLNYSEASEIVVNVLSNPAMLPISIGVFGSWGTGKSTILNLIEQKLQAEKKKIISLLSLMHGFIRVLMMQELH
ncbi:hypothetical protein ABNIH10_15083 [Acinetobacter baumannii ABNIH10]|nr:hypothetical protein ABNIH10_15083 [Acinetobacter baumannii ABNIH10]